MKLYSRNSTGDVFGCKGPARPTDTCGQSHISHCLWDSCKLSLRTRFDSRMGSHHTERSTSAAAADPVVWQVLNQACLWLEGSISCSSFRRSWRPKVGPDLTPVKPTAAGTLPAPSSSRRSCRPRVRRRSESGQKPQACVEPTNSATHTKAAEPGRRLQLTQGTIRPQKKSSDRASGPKCQSQRQRTPQLLEDLVFH